MRNDGKFPECPNCKTAQAPESTGAPGVFCCQCCSRLFMVKKEGAAGVDSSHTPTAPVRAAR